MATYLHHFNPLYKKLLSSIYNSTIEQVRNASKKSGTSNPRKAAGGRSARYGIKVYHGQYINAGQLLVHQPTINFCPGLNVGVGPLARLYAKTSGKVYFSLEETNFDENNYLVKAKYPARVPIYKTYVNVIPEPEPQEFKLVETF